MPTSANRIWFLIWILALVPTVVLMYQHLNRDPHASEFAAVAELVRTSYVEDVEERDLFENAMRGLLAGLDPYSEYIAPESMQSVDEVLNREYAGVGMKIDKRNVDGALIVLSSFFETPAHRAGIRPGDVILAIDGVSTRGMSRTEAVKRIRGIAGKDVRLRLHRVGEQHEIELDITRANIVVPSLIGDHRRPNRSWDFALPEDPRIAHLRLISFSKRAVDELQAALSAADRLPFSAVILDLRNNPGGHVEAAVAVCDFFIDDGVIVTTRDRNGMVRERFVATQPVGLPTSVPVAVLVNEYSASSSEIVAACLQDQQRAVIIGERTWGKASIQTVFSLNQSGGGLKLTTATFWRPSGITIHRARGPDELQTWGVVPNEGFEVSQSDEEDAQLVELRRWRDVPRSENHSSITPLERLSPDTGATGEGQDVTAVEDRVLRRAVEYLQSQI